MTTIVEPKQYIVKLWGKQRVRMDQTYRLMKYVLQVAHDGKVLLHNVVTGQLVVLDQEEAELVKTMPAKFSSRMEQLVAEYYLVPEDYDEHQQTIQLREILWRMDSAGKNLEKIRRYTILPTTACNARCYYCYEQGLYTETMSEQTADDAVRFISDHSGKSKIFIRWFGGEPTVADNRIDQICRGLIQNGIDYTSSMTTNGYLFDEEMVLRAKTLWNLKRLMISIDGTERHYNDIKSYVNVKDNPYQRIMHNVGIFLRNGIKVDLRMNFDLGNFQDFDELLDEIIERFQGNEHLQLYAFPVKGVYPDKTGQVNHGSESWFDNKLVEMNSKAQEAGLFCRSLELPSLFFSSCNAGDPSSMVIGPRGELARCTRIFSREDQIIGNVKEGITDFSYLDVWSRFADPEHCTGCILYPNCILLESCPGKGVCFKKEAVRQYAEVILNAFRYWLKHRNFERSGIS